MSFVKWSIQIAEVKHRQSWESNANPGIGFCNTEQNKGPGYRPLTLKKLAAEIAVGPAWKLILWVFKKGYASSF